MPQTVTPKLHRTITCAANDLVTINYTGKQADGLAYLYNGGPGVVWISLDPGTAAAPATAACYRMAVNSGVTIGSLGVGTVITANSDTAATFLSVLFL